MKKAKKTPKHSKPSRTDRPKKDGKRALTDQELSRASGGRERPPIEPITITKTSDSSSS